jgi:hypothetical protein
MPGFQIFRTNSTQRGEINLMLMNGAAVRELARYKLDLVGV